MESLATVKGQALGSSTVDRVVESIKVSMPILEECIIQTAAEKDQNYHDVLCKLWVNSQDSLASVSGPLSATTVEAFEQLQEGVARIRASLKGQQPQTDSKSHAESLLKACGAIEQYADDGSEFMRELHGKYLDRQDIAQTLRLSQKHRTHYEKVARTSLQKFIDDSTKYADGCTEGGCWHDFIGARETWPAVVKAAKQEHSLMSNMGVKRTELEGTAPEAPNMFFSHSTLRSRAHE